MDDNDAVEAPDCGWHGWALSRETGARALFIGTLPGRKSICLYESEGTSLFVYAYFRGEESARKARNLLDYLMNMPKVTTS
jgi:hypothetical protein